MCLAAEVPKDEIGADVTKGDEHTLTGFTPNETQILIAKLLKDHKELFLEITRRIFSDDGLLDEKSRIDEEIIEKVTKMIKDLDEDDFPKDVKDMMLDISNKLMKKHPNFVNKLVRKTAKEMFKHMTIDTQAVLMSRDGQMDKKMITSVINAFNKFTATGGPKEVVKFATRSYPVLVFRLTRHYGKKYKRVIRRMARRSRLAVESDREAALSQVSSSGKTNLTGTVLLDDEMGYF